PRSTASTPRIRSAIRAPSATQKSASTRQLTRTSRSWTPPRSPFAATRSCRSTSSTSSRRTRCGASCWAKMRARSFTYDEDLMVIADLKKTTDQKMDKSVQSFKADLAKVRTGRAHTGLLDHITVDYYGSQMPLNQVAKVTLLDSRTIGVTPFEKKMTQAVEKAIRDSDLGL